MNIYFIEPYYIFYWNEITGKTKIISNSHIKSGKNITIRNNQDGYLCAKINNKTLILHQFIGEKLFSKKKYGYVINHIDCNKHNNSKNNLEYITIRENIEHAIKNGLHVSSHPERHGHYKDGRSLKNRMNEYKLNWYHEHKKQKNG